MRYIPVMQIVMIIVGVITVATLSLVGLVHLRDPEPPESKYCFKGHDESYKADGDSELRFVCEEWRDTHFKYDQQGAK
jgi:hypothetical protein